MATTVSHSAPRVVSSDSATRLDTIRSSRQSYAAAVSASVGSRFFSRFVSLVLVVAAARFLSVESFGAYSYLVSLALTFSVLANIGVAPVVARRIAGGALSARDGLRAGMPVAVLTFGVLAILVSLVAWATSPGGTGVAAAALVGAYVLVTGPFDLNCAVLRAVGRPHQEAASLVGSAIGFVAIGLPIMILGHSIVALLAAFAAKEVLGLVVSAVFLARSLPGDGSERAAPGISRRELVLTGSVVAMSAVAAAVLLRVPLQVLGNLAGPSDVAFFSVASRVADVWFLLGTSVGLAMFPFAARGHRRAGATLSFDRRTLVLAGSALTAVGVAAALLMPLAVPLVFGSGYREVSGLAAVVALTAPLYVLPSVLRQLLIARGCEAATLAAHLAALAVAALLAAVAIPAWGRDGAVLTLCVSFFVLTIALGAVVVRTRLR